MLALSMLLIGCDRDAGEYRLVNSDVPPVIDMGTITPITEADGFHSGDGLAGFDQVLYDQVGASSSGAVVSGATVQFMGTGDLVCIVVDPEAVYWVKTIDKDPPSEPYNYADRIEDDGDIDMFVGLSAYYNGSPGIEIGDFERPYTDALGVEHFLDYNECKQSGYNGTTGVHAGRGAVEYCQIDTTLHPGIPYTILLKAFALPIDDQTLNFGVAVVATACRSVSKDECTIPNEVGLGEDANGFSELETAFCGGASAVNSYCAEHLDDSNAPCNEGYTPGG